MNTPSADCFGRFGGRNSAIDDVTTPCDCLLNGEFLTKFSFSDSRPIRRYFWLSADKLELRWGSSKEDSRYLNVALTEAVGIVFGPATTTFSRVGESVQPWRCFSLLFVGRTLDLYSIGDTAHVWFLVLQEVLKAVMMPACYVISPKEITRRKVQMKIRYKARELNRSLSEHFRLCVRETFLKLNGLAESSVGAQVRARGLSKDAMDGFRDSLFELKCELNALKQLVVDSKFPVDEVRRTVTKQAQDIWRSLRSDDSEIRALESRLQLADSERRRLHNELIDMKGNIRVFTRVRPLLETERSLENALMTDEKSVVVQSSTRIAAYNCNDARKRLFDLDFVFGPDSTQENVYREVHPFVQSAIDGFNVCIFAYGATGSGKTHTMEGTVEAAGINIRAIEEVFKSLSKNQLVSISVVQIYNEQVSDLLNKMEPLEVKLRGGEDFIIPDLTQTVAHSASTAISLIRSAFSLRTTNCTKINANSSRSHCVVTVRICSGQNPPNQVIGILNLIDLAGSENVNKSGAQGTVLKEAQNINKSLSSLGDVIQQLIATKRAPKTSTNHIPYRNSKLTMILRNSLKGNSKVLMIAQVSPKQTDIVESLGSLMFATRVRTVELGKASLLAPLVSSRE